MSEDLARLDFVDTFCMDMPGDIGERMRAAVGRRKKKIAEIGYPAFRAEYEAESKRRLENMEQQARAKYAKRLLEVSGLGEKFFTRTFMTFRATPQNGAALDACLNLVDGKRTKGIILSGAHGIGKTHLAAAIVNAMTEKGRQAYFGNVVDIVDEVKDNFKTGTEKVIGRILDCRLLVIDDLGAEHTKQESGWIDSLLYKIINRAYESNKTLVITTNLSDYDLAKRYNTRIISRLHEMCEWISYGGKDNRLDMEPTNEKMPF